MAPRCGDAIITAPEECDDGNLLDDDACVSSTCLENVCGDGHWNPLVEGCDDSNDVEGDGCRTSCALPGCGDAVASDGEECDDGNAEIWG